MLKKYKKNCIAIIAIIILVLSNTVILEASTTIEPNENQYLVMKATNINKLEDGSKQLIFELWGYEIDFKRI